MNSLARLLCCLLAVASAAPASAGSLRVDPVHISIGESRRSAAVTVVNTAAEPVMIRAYPLAWSQVDGEDVYSETNAVIVSPPIVTMAAGAKQVIRIGFRNPGASRGAWRLVIEEVPQPRLESDGIQVALRLNLPLFVQLKAAKAGDLRWSAWRAHDGIWTLEAQNPSSGYVRLEPVDFTGATGIRHASWLRLGTVLPNSHRRWRIEGEPDVADPVRFEQIVRRESPNERLANRSARD